MNTVVVLSGGLDSVVLAHVVRAEGHEGIALSVNYGQRHVQELDYAQSAARRLGMPWRVIDLAAAGLAGLWAGSSLTDDVVPVASVGDAGPNSRSHVVANRNALFLAVAFTVAATSQCRRVAIAVSATDQAIADCTPEFLAAFEQMEALSLSGMANVEIFAPFAKLTKSEVVRIGQNLSVPWADTWSCFNRGARHCGRCLACAQRQEAFAEACLPDPTEYASPAVRKL